MSFDFVNFDDDNVMESNVDDADKIQIDISFDEDFYEEELKLEENEESEDKEESEEDEEVNTSLVKLHLREAKKLLGKLMKETNMFNNNK